MAPKGKYDVTVRNDCIRCVFSPFIKEIDEDLRPKPEVCNTTAWIGWSLCFFTCGFLPCAFYLEDDYACASCTGMNGTEFAEDNEGYSISED